MGRPFWKLFCAFWLAFFAIGAASTAALWLMRKPSFNSGPPPLYLAPEFFVNNSRLPPNILLRQQRINDTLPPFTPDMGRGAMAQWSLLQASQFARDSRTFPRGFRPAPPPPGNLVSLMIGIALLISVGLSLLLDRYFMRPVNVLRGVFHAVAKGQLDIRMRTMIGGRRDDMAALDYDFNHMAQHMQKFIAAQQRLIHDVSHEMRSPLARLHAAIGLARQDPQKLCATLERIEYESNRLETIIENMLLLARLESDTGHPQREPVNLIVLLAAVVSDAQFEVDAAVSTINFVCSGECVIDGHAELLHRAFENIVRNALKFTAPDSSIDVDARRDAAQFRMTVADRGPGVNADEIPLLFEPFYRAKESARSTTGFGLGLTIARRAVELHGGSIGINNREGGGLVVTIALPLPALCGS